MNREITDEFLRDIYGEPRELVREAWAPKLDDASRRWVDSTTLLLISSGNADGDIDITPRGGESGFIHILDDQNIVFLDERGNNKIHTLRNLVSRPVVGLMFLIPGLGEVLRAYGSATLITDSKRIDSLGGSTTRNRSAVNISIHKIFPHCSKAFARGGMWDTDRWIDRTEKAVPGLMELAEGMAATRHDDD
jgi:PPOX class probable FMN-dependent enzyme